MSKKLLAFIFVFIMSFQLAACGNSTSGKEDTSPEGSSNSGKTEEQGEDITELTFMHWEGVDSQAEYEEIFAKYYETHPNIRIKQLPVDGSNYLTKLTSMAASGDLPDLFQMSEAYQIYWNEEGAYAKMDDDWYKEDEKKLDYCTYSYDGEFVAYQFSTENEALFYNKDYFDEKGMEYPPSKVEDAWSWDKFVEVAKSLTFDKNGNTPNDAGFDPDNIVSYGCYISNAAWQLHGWMAGNGGGFVSEDGKELLLGKDESIEAVQKIADLINVYHVMPSPGVASELSSEDILLASNQIAMVVTGTWIMGTTVGIAAEKGELNYGIGVLPTLKVPASVNNGPTLVVSSDTKHFEEAAEFCKWFAADENHMVVIKSGLMLTTEEKYYSSEDMIREWADNDRHPDIEEMIDFCDYSLNHTVQTMYAHNLVMGKISEIFEDEIAPVWEGTATAQEVIKNRIMPVVEPIFESNQIN